MAIRRVSELGALLVCLAAAWAAPAGAAATHGAAAPALPVAGNAAASTPAAAAPGDPSATGGPIGAPDPLVANGFGSPACFDRAQLAALDPAARTNCAASGLTTSAAPIGHYAFDVHIDTGLTAVGNNFNAAFQDVLLEPVWMCLLWLIHVALVALQWCYSVDLLSPAALGPLAGGLDEIHREVARPWLGLVLALSAVAFAYDGIVRRKVAETLAQAGVMVLMMVAGLWVIADPAGTVGEVHRLANDASLGALAVTSPAPGHGPGSGLESGLHDVFDSAVSGPWCFLEFGDVNWCRNPGRLDPALRAEAARIAKIDRAALACTGTAVIVGTPFRVCAAHDQLARIELTAQADALDRARSNGAMMLALPPDSKPRNGINSDAQNPSLLHAMCGTAQATDCTAAAGPQAQFRTEQGTWARGAGLALIVCGSIGMFALLGFIGMRLLASSMLAALLLLLAPVAVLAPAFGDGGRASFRLWSTRLLGAILAKLVYSVYLGVVLLLLNVIESLPALGWWMQWLLVAAFWWIAFTHRHKLLEHVIVERAQPRGGGSLGRRIFEARQATRLAADVGRGAGATARSAADLLRKLPNPDFHWPKLPRGRSRDSPAANGVLGLEQVNRSLESEHAEALALRAESGSSKREIELLDSRHARLLSERETAIAHGDGRRAVSLELRAQQVDEHASTLRTATAWADQQGARGEQLRRETGLVHDAPARERRGAMFDAQAELRPQLAHPDDARSGRRDYPTLSPLGGISRSEYEHASAPVQRAARLEIDRQLERRREERGSRPLSEARKQRGRRPADIAARPQPREVSARGRQFARHPGPE